MGPGLFKFSSQQGAQLSDLRVREESRCAGRNTSAAGGETPSRCHRERPQAAADCSPANLVGTVFDWRFSPLQRELTSLTHGTEGQREDSDSSCHSVTGPTFLCWALVAPVPNGTEGLPRPLRCAASIPAPPNWANMNSPWTISYHLMWLQFSPIFLGVSVDFKRFVP